MITIKLSFRIEEETIDELVKIHRKNRYSIDFLRLNNMGVIVVGRGSWVQKSWVVGS